MKGLRGQFEQALSYVQQALQLVRQLTGTQQVSLQGYADYELGNSIETRETGNLPSSTSMQRELSFDMTRMIPSLI